MFNLESFVLIGGKSSRLGRDKALLELGGLTFAERAVLTVNNGLLPEKIFLIAAHEKQFVSWPEKIPVIFDLQKNLGVFGALLTALQTARRRWIFVLACDYPFVSEELLKYLANFISSDFDAVVPVQKDERVQPLCAFYRVETCRKTVENLVKAGEKPPPLRAIFQTVKTRFVRFEEFAGLPGAENFFLNVNTPEDLEKAQNIASEKNYEQIYQTGPR